MVVYIFSIYSIYSIEHSATLIDNILTNKIFRSDSKYLSGIILEDISDHLPIFISVHIFLALWSQIIPIIEISSSCIC